jgi:predicted heme/steroid binding protein
MKQTKKVKKRKSPFIILLLVFVIGASVSFIYIKKQFSPCAQFLRDHADDASLPQFTANDLSQYDGIHNEKIYLGYHCIVYDVSEGKDQYYGEGKGYHYLVGRDATKQLEIFGGDIIESKYPKVGYITN